MENVQAQVLLRPYTPRHWATRRKPPIPNQLRKRTSQPHQRVEAHFTEIYFGRGILRIFHSPLKFEFFPETGENLKLKIIDLITTSNWIIYCGNLTEIDGLPKDFEVSYQGIETQPIIVAPKTHTTISFRLRGHNRVFSINQDRTIDIAEDLVDHISVNDLTKV